MRERLLDGVGWLAHLVQVRAGSAPKVVQDDRRLLGEAAGRPFVDKGLMLGWLWAVWSAWERFIFQYKTG